MLKKTHAIVSFTPVYILTSSLELSLYSVLFGIVSDIDHTLGLRHRSVTHSLLFLVISSITLLLFISKTLAIVAFYAIASHIALDMLTSSGVELYWPIKRRKRIARFKYDSIIVNFLLIAACLLAIYLKISGEIGQILSIMH